MTGRYWLPDGSARRTRTTRWFWILGSAALVIALWWVTGYSSAKVAPTGTVVEELVLNLPGGPADPQPSGMVRVPVTTTASSAAQAPASDAAANTDSPGAPAPDEALHVAARAPVAATVEPAQAAPAARAATEPDSRLPEVQPGVLRDANLAAAGPAPGETVHEIVRGDTLGRIFDAQGLSPQLLHALLEADEELLALDVLRPGHRLTFKRDPASGELQEMELYIHAGHRVAYQRLDDGGFGYEERLNPGLWQEELLAGDIQGSFYVSARRAGLSDADIAAISKMFEAQINFARDIQAGDTFEVIRSLQLVDGLSTGQTRVEAVRIVRRSRTHAAFLHEDGNYYDLKGESLARAFLRLPVSQRHRISSHFNPRRVHPVTGRVAPHNGTDFAMPIGSPVMSTGDGVVTRVGNHPFAGRYVEIQHSGQYKTRYLHLHRVLVQRGQSVARGQRIAQSGNTGRSTGPHLHFELHVNGRPVDPLRANIPMASAVPKEQMPAFRERVDSLLAMMAQPERYLAQR